MAIEGNGDCTAFGAEVCEEAFPLDLHLSRA
jgi:hypothetical protein